MLSPKTRPRPLKTLLQVFRRSSVCFYPCAGFVYTRIEALHPTQILKPGSYLRTVPTPLGLSDVDSVG